MTAQSLVDVGTGDIRFCCPLPGEQEARSSVESWSVRERRRERPEREEEVWRGAVTRAL